MDGVDGADVVAAGADQVCEAAAAVTAAQADGRDRLDPQLLAELRRRYDDAVSWGITTNRHRDWPKGSGSVVSAQLASRVWTITATAERTGLNPLTTWAPISMPARRPAAQPPRARRWPGSSPGRRATPTSRRGGRPSTHRAPRLRPPHPAPAATHHPTPARPPLARNALT